MGHNCRGKSGRRGSNQEISLLGRQSVAISPLDSFQSAQQVHLVRPHSVVDNSDFCPSHLTVHSDAL
jgi:hypothetical protein